jgi:hypothetical protein
MGLFSRKTDDDNVREYRDARKALDDNQRAEKKAGTREETDRYRELNARVLDAEKRIPWHRR